MSDIEIVPTEFESEGQMVRGDFVIPEGGGPFPGICKFHGLPGGADQISGLSTRLAEAGYAVLTFDFRGFRRSEGLFSLEGEIQDARFAVTHLLDSEFTIEDWAGVYGASYGGAVAILSAVRDDRIKAVSVRAPVYDTLWFAESPMIQPTVDEIVRISPNEMHGLADPVIQKEILTLMIEDSRIYNPIDEVDEISPRPLFIVTGSADCGIPMEGVRRLFDSAKKPKEFAVVEGADHNLSNPDHYAMTCELVISWFREAYPQ
ncbi:MAG: alpha/beta hydrolase [Candidatus Thorarchaeota archaeon]|jgi:dipeptidyl aminopeptidase/acylaminoacyl peptidase